MITNTSIGSMGRLGNQLFQIAATIGVAKKNNKSYGFNKWDYSFWFKNNLPVKHPAIYKKLNEVHFHYSEFDLYSSSDYDLKGYFQSYKYWKHCEEEIKIQFEFTDELVKDCLLRFPDNNKKNLAIHIRRGDYVNNPSHYNLSLRYYINALKLFNLDEYNLIFFSDDIEYAKFYFGCLPNSYFMNGTEIEDLCQMTLCDDFIIANSTFSWWGAYLSTSPNKTIVRPLEHFSGGQLKLNIKDYYPDNWLIISDEWKIDLEDVHFIIPVQYDSGDRLVNITASVSYLIKYFKTQITVIENNGDKFKYLANQYVVHKQVSHKHFHRTKMINDVAKSVNNRFIVNYDCDVLINPVQVWQSYNLLDADNDIVYPYNGNWRNIPKGLFRKELYGLGDLKGPIESYGGAIFMSRLPFLIAGGENENFISWGPEDAERYTRFLKLGLSIERVNGPLFHLEHHRGKDSGRRNPFIEHNRKEWHKIRLMSIEELWKYVKTWHWALND
jgi:hypothetical protein